MLLCWFLLVLHFSEEIFFFFFSFLFICEGVAYNYGEIEVRTKRKRVHTATDEKYAFRAPLVVLSDEENEREMLARAQFVASSLYKSKSVNGAIFFIDSKVLADA